MVSKNSVGPVRMMSIQHSEDGKSTLVQLERPERRPEAPPVTAKTPHRRTLPDGEHWVDVLGGGSNVERLFIQSVMEWIKDFEGVQAEIEAMTLLSTFLADRVAGHNLQTPAGDPLPMGLDLAWELGWNDMWSLINLIMSPPRVFADPKAESPSSGGSPTSD